jgi:class 3 adenylate cyclase
MIEIIKEVRDQTEDENLKNLDMRIGIHTGKVVAGIIGSKVVRYDIFGEGVLIANKMESNGVPGKVCASEETRKMVAQMPEIYNEFMFVEHKVFQLENIKKWVKSYIVTPKENDSMASGMISSEYHNKSLSDSGKLDEDSFESNNPIDKSPNGDRDDDNVFGQ